MYVEFQKSFSASDADEGSFFDSGDCIELDDGQARTLLSKGIVKVLEDTYSSLPK